MKKYLKQGDTWTPELTITEIDEDGVETAYDCIGCIAKMWIKAQLRETAPELFELDVNWTDQAGGIGYFSFTHAMSVTLLGRYWYEVILYEELGLDIVKTLIQNRLIIGTTLEADL